MTDPISSKQSLSCHGYFQPSLSAVPPQQSFTLSFSRFIQRRRNIFVVSHRSQPVNDPQYFDDAIVYFSSDCCRNSLALAAISSMLFLRLLLFLLKRSCCRPCHNFCLVPSSCSAVTITLIGYLLLRLATTSLPGQPDSMACLALEYSWNPPSQLAD